MNKLAFIPLDPKEAAAISRYAFRDLIDNLTGQKQRKLVNKFDTVSIPKKTSEGGFDWSLEPKWSGGRFFSSFEKSIPMKTFKASSYDKFKELEDLIGNPNADPTELVSQIVSTGIAGGKKLSSKQRKQLADRLALVKLLREGEVRPRFDITVTNRPGYALRNLDDLYRGKDSREELLGEKWRQDAMSIGWNKRNTLSLRDSVTLDMLKDKYWKLSYAPRSYQSGFPANLWYVPGKLFEKLNKLKGYKDKDYNLNQAVNAIVKEFGITDPKVTETILSLLPTWSGSVKDLVALARMV
jgi:hypothetical protein